MSVESTHVGIGASSGRTGHDVRQSAAPLSPAEEKRIARELSPRVAWPTLGLAVILPVAYLAIAQAGWERMMPLWACAIVLSIVGYAHYTLVHEAIHDNLVPGHPRLRWLNSVVGWIGALGLGYNWPMLMRTHVLHHAQTNTDQDPDIWVKGGFGALLVKAPAYVFRALIPLTLMRVVAPKYYRHEADYLRGSELVQADAVAFAVLASLVITIAIGRFSDWLFLLLIPAVVGSSLLAIFFQWLPHHPFDQTARYRNTRISLWWGGELATLQQNLHLIHHLWPGVPFYNYAALYRRLRPTLLAKGSRIEGFMTGAHAKDLSAT